MVIDNVVNKNVGITDTPNELKRKLGINNNEI